MRISCHAYPSHLLIFWRFCHGFCPAQRGDHPHTIRKRLIASQEGVSPMAWSPPRPSQATLLGFVAWRDRTALPLQVPAEQRGQATSHREQAAAAWSPMPKHAAPCPKGQLSPQARRRHKGLISRAGVCGWFQSVPARLRDPPSVRRGASDVGGGEELQVPHMKPGPAFAWNPSSSGPAVTSGCPTGCWSCEAGMPF